MTAPPGGFATSGALCPMVRRALERAGLAPPCPGAPLLRHALATTLLHAGASRGARRDLLRHRRPQTPAIDAKGAPAACGALAQPWPGGAVGVHDAPPAQRPSPAGVRWG